MLDENKSLKESINNNKIEFDNLFVKLNNQLLDIKQGLNKESQIKEYNDLKTENLSLNYILKEKINEIDTLNIRINFMNKEKKYLEIQKREIENREKELQQKYNLLIQEKNEFENKRKEFENELKINEKIKQENHNFNMQNQKLLNEIQEKQSKLNDLGTSIKESILSIEKCDTNELIYLIDKNKKNNYNINSDNNNKINLIITNNSQELIKCPPLAINASPIRAYERPAIIGLNNIGATGFMNATIQCFSQTKGLTNYFLDPKNKNQIVNNNSRGQLQLSPIYLDLVQKLWPKNYEYNSFSPFDFINIVEKMNPLFKKGQPGDSKDFIIFLLEQFHKELKESKENNRILNNRNIYINHYDKQETMNYFFEEFMKETSIISDLFFGIIETTNVCLNCKINYNSRGMNNPIFYNFQKINCIIFPLEEINYNINCYIPNPENNIISINDCFIFYQKTKVLNQYFCKNCNQVNDSLYTTNIYSSPNILIVILDRGKDNVYNVKLEFTERIDVTQFILRKDKPIIEYDLYGVITLITKINGVAHFVASCKTPVDNKWYIFDDAVVRPINNIKGGIIDYGTPYILFFRKI